MKRKQNRKGFTIVELVIVIAVIGILAAVLVPTFGNVIENANKSAALQEAKNLHTEYITEKGTDGNFENTLAIETSGGYYVEVTNGKFEDSSNINKDAPTTPGTKILSKDANGLVYTCKGQENAQSGSSNCSWCGKTHTTTPQ